eukprot:m.231597 g.231597  ORF g.231597 m.231597 type:complete len:51 (+) comp54278_c1_seq12:793-945(+)
MLAPNASLSLSLNAANLLEPSSSGTSKNSLVNSNLENTFASRFEMSSTRG